MNNREIKRLHKLEKYYWWHIGRKSILGTFIKRARLPAGPRILDVGCGTGETTKFLGKFGEVWGVDISGEALDFCRARGVKNLEQGSACELPFKERSFDLVAMLDILEHLDEDHEALREAQRVLKDGGYLLVTVPACPFLWSEHDEALSHKRRYSKQELRMKVEGAGFKIEKFSYAIFFLALPIVLWRGFQRVFVRSSYPKSSYVILPPWLNRFFVFLLRLEARLLKYIDLPFGVSLVCLARKEVYYLE